MKTNENDKSSNTLHTCVEYTVALCQKAAVLIENAKAAIASEFQDGLEETEHLLRLAMNEAEALSWETDYPHLLFPTLATEKAVAVANWRTHQQAVKETQRALVA